MPDDHHTEIAQLRPANWTGTRTSSPAASKPWTPARRSAPAFRTSWPRSAPNKTHALA